MSDNDASQATMYFHTAIGADSVWFQSWRPTSLAGNVGVCAGVFLLAVMERWLMSLRRVWEHGWSSCHDEADSEASTTTALRRVSSTSTAYLPLNSDLHLKPHEGVWSPLPRSEALASPPFRIKVDLARGGLQALQTTLHYLLMLVVMTFNAWWTISVILGAGVGEVCFGRLGVGHDGGNH